MYDTLVKFEIYILNLISAVRCEPLDKLMIFFTTLADNGAIWIILALMLLIFKKSRKLGVCISIALIINFLLVNVITKPLVQRMRPYDISANLKIIIAFPGDFSFPSGHTSASFAAACALLYNNRKWGIASVVLACLIAFSRLYLSVHFPTDVIFGVLFGVFSAYIANFLCQKNYFVNHKNI